MNRILRQWLPWQCAFLALAWLGLQTAAADESAEGLALFENRIRPVLMESCYECHSSKAESIEGELLLDNRAAVARGGRSGPVLAAGDGDSSRLLEALTYSDASLQMPPAGKLPDEVIADFHRWIELGAPDPRTDGAVPVETIATRSAKHWAFQPPVRPALPPPDADGWARKPLDRLILAELQAAQLNPTRPASRRELVRRLYVDLTGLHPTWEEVEAFASDESPQADEQLVDRLLASPQFGERWARHWLDVARFADTKGYVFLEERDYPHAYKYRDWVITAFNDDLPIDQFFKYQIAADQMLESEEPADADRRHLAAQGFITLGRRFINNPHDIIADRIDVVFRGMMGMTVACARCHDHKFDPISDEDYYALYGVFASTEEKQDEEFPLRLVDKPEPVNVGVFLRGNALNRGEAVPRAFPKFFAGEHAEFQQGSGRLELASAIASPNNPLTARVFVNRVWGHLFGEELVRTPSDFGLQCEAPREQAVLDLLATDFVANRWSLKWLVRELVTSSTYRLASESEPALLAADPKNELWGRANRRRLDFEALRDSLLATAGRLDLRVGGESEEISGDEGGLRRTLYAHIDRQNLPGVFRTFDFANPDAHSPERLQTVVPQQALFLLNSPMVQVVARDVVHSLVGATPAARIADLYRHVLARRPSDEETASALEFLSRNQPAPMPPDEWSFGYGGIVTENDKVAVQFAPLTRFVENRWQPSDKFPDDQFLFVSLTSLGGHPGIGLDRSTIRRWTAPAGGDLTITGELERPSEEGDGVDGVIVSSQRGTLSQWTVERGKLATNLHLKNVVPGEQIDFVVSCRTDAQHDTYHWPIKLVLSVPGAERTWSSEQGFHGPAAEPLDLWAQLAQVLLVSNEFIFVD